MFRKAKDPHAGWKVCFKKQHHAVVTKDITYASYREVVTDSSHDTYTKMLYSGQYIDLGSEGKVWETSEGWLNEKDIKFPVTDATRY